MLTNNHKNIASILHIGTFSKYLFPFGNFIVPLIIWTTNKDKSEFIDLHGKQVINFQLSITLYLFVILLILIPFIIHFGINIENLENMNGTISFYELTKFPISLIMFILSTGLIIGLSILELYATIKAALKANE